MQGQNAPGLHCPDYNAIRPPANSVSMYVTRPASYGGI